MNGRTVPPPLRGLLRALYRRFVPPSPPFARLLFAEQGEDAVLQGLFARKNGPGFYVDVGAYHPHQFSVTAAFYSQGWCGINLEPRVGSKAEFDRARPRDLNLELAVSDVSGSQAYFEFNEPLFNGLNPDHTADWQQRHGCRVVASHEVPVRRLDSVLDEHLAPGQCIDFLTVDVEGTELDVLRSNDWARFRPEVVLVEDLNAPRLGDVLTSSVTLFLDDQGYAPIGKTRHTVIYRLNNCIDATRTD